ncbi:T9SS type A sorting domain-containing protein [bacterium]|nr:T9SS type A sorting domain-containing protein [bacterium]
MRRLLILLLTALVLLPTTTSAYWFEYSSIRENMQLAPDTAWVGGPFASIPIAGEKSLLVVRMTNGVGNAYQIIDKYGGFEFSEYQQVSTEPYILGNLGPASAESDSMGGAVVQWYRSDDESVHAQKIDAQGNRIWGDEGICFMDWRRDIPIDYDFNTDGMGGFLYAYGTENLYDTLRVIRYNQFGQSVWSEVGVDVCIHPYDKDNPKVSPDGEGGAYVAWQDNRPSDYYSLRLQHIDASGNPLWIHNGVLVNELIPFNHDPIPDGQGGVIITCNQIIHRLDAFTGEELWRQTLDLTASGSKPQIVPGEPGYYYVGFTKFYPFQFRAQRFDLNGHFYWGDEFGRLVATYENYLPSLGYEGEKNFVYKAPYFYAGLVFRHPENIFDVAIVAQKMDSEGNHLWGSGAQIASYEFGAIYWMHLNPQASANGGMAIVWFESGDDKLWGKHVNPDGALGGPIFPPPVEKKPGQITANVNVSGLSFTLHTATHVTIDLFNILGQQVQTISEGFRQAGSYSIQLDERNLASGVYLARLQAGSETKVVKIAVVR